MAASTFHSFCDLPFELREQIWTLALRPDRPSAHCFTIFDAQEADELSALQSYAMHHKFPEYCDLAAPRSNKSDIKTISWTVSNPSIYLTDSGMWTACKESRDVMEKRFDTRTWRANRPKDSADYRWDFQDPRHDTPATGIFTSNGETQCFTVIPKRDLFCLQPYNFNTVAWSSLTVSAQLFSYCHGFQLKHIAIEFDPKHDYHVPPFPTAPQPMPVEDYYIHGEFSKEVTDCFEEAAFSVPPDLRIWLIDPRLKRRPGVPFEEDKRHVFYNSSGRYVEIEDYDKAWYSTWDTIEFGWGWACLPGLHEYLNEFLEKNRYDLCCSNLGVLAYEPFD
ncbi:hypothetical protein BKA56DRAFT_676926 [Ilyonectria sp. MPI-CAGE-AT-0026]|nr:hypothetical protein BKA56DRAFT_676926 [Ilyonectria sp. MPI-CAGE-AT-0026]